jgi:polysaccharide export outer membrane protein
MVGVQSVAAQDYVLGPGDVLSISVYGYDELQLKEAIVRPDGKLAFPLIGELQAAGLSAGQLTETITVSLGEYVKTPRVIVNVEKFRTTRVYVLGEVARPGLFELEKQHNLLDAIGIAGGFKETAAKKKVFVIHKDQPDKPVKVNLLKLLERADMTQNITLAEGDVVYVTRNHKIVFARDILPYIGAAYQVDRFGKD